jgi:SAM-dependent methyltransferase
MRQLRKLCAGGDGHLVHLYWPDNERYFRENRDRLKSKGHWLFVATPGHGARLPDDVPRRRSINFLVADDKFIEGYESAAEARGLRHGIMVRRSAIEDLSKLPGYDFAEVRVGHPRRHRVTSFNDYWRFDIGSRRYGVLHDLQYATVVRLATPDGVAARRIRISHESVLAWW